MIIGKPAPVIWSRLQYGVPHLSVVAVCQNVIVGEDNRLAVLLYETA
jgi:hypothetical protein